MRGQLPPRLTDRVLIDLDGLTAWEAHVVAVLAGPRGVRIAGARRRADRRRREAAGRLVAGSRQCRSVDAVAALADGLARPRPRRRRGRDSPTLERGRRGSRRRPAPAGRRGSPTIRRPASPNSTPATSCRSGSDYAGAVRRYLAAKAFGAWITYQADAAVSLAAWLTLCHAVLRIEMRASLRRRVTPARPRVAGAGDSPVRPAVVPLRRQSRDRQDTGQLLA